MMLTTTEVARRLALHPATVRRWLQRGRVRYQRVGHFRAVSGDELRRLLRERAAEAKRKGGSDR